MSTKEYKKYNKRIKQQFVCKIKFSLFLFIITKDFVLFIFSMILYDAADGGDDHHQHRHQHHCDIIVMACKACVAKIY